MTGLSVTAWRDPWHVRLVREIKRDPQRAVKRAVAWAVVAWCTVGWLLVVPYFVWGLA